MIAHFGIYGIIYKNQQILLIEKARGPYTGKYDLPGGSPEAHESNSETLKRELKEELGINTLKYHKAFEDCITLLYTFTDKNTNTTTTLRHTAKLYLVTEYSGTVNDFGDGEDCKLPVWVDIAMLTTDNASPFVCYVKDFTL